GRRPAQRNLAGIAGGCDLELLSGRRVDRVGRAVEDAVSGADRLPRVRAGRNVRLTRQHHDAHLSGTGRWPDAITAPQLVNLETHVRPARRFRRDDRGLRGSPHHEPAHRCHRRRACSRSCSSRAFFTSADSETSATGTSHQLSYDGTPSYRSTGTWITTVRSIFFAATSASRNSSTLRVRNTCAPSPSAFSARSTGRRSPSP